MLSLLFEHVMVSKYCASEQRRGQATTFFKFSDFLLRGNDILRICSEFKHWQEGSVIQSMEETCSDIILNLTALINDGTEMFAALRKKAIEGSRARSPLLGPAPLLASQGTNFGNVLRACALVFLQSLDYWNKLKVLKLLLTQNWWRQWHFTLQLTVLVLLMAATVQAQ